MSHATVVRTHGGYHTSITARHHTVHADAPIADGGTDTAPTPEELFLGSLGACAAMTAKMYANRKQWPLIDVEIVMDVERKPREAYPDAPGDAPYVHEVSERITLVGPALTDEQRERIHEIMGRCPVRRIVTGPVYILEEVMLAPTEE
jgi:putative redox protein